MLGICFCVLCAVSVLCALCTGNFAALSNAVTDGAGQAVGLCLSLAGMSALWGGVMAVLREAGAIRVLARALSPILRHVFPAAWREAELREEITAAVSANILGIGNAATPLALRAMARLQERNPTPERASDDMITLAVLATASPALLPVTLITLLREAGAAQPYAIVVPVWIVSFTCAAAAVILCRGAAWASGGHHD